MSIRTRLEVHFQFKALGATWRSEILAGVTTFMTMAYIVFVNPSILHEAGMPLGAVTAATCLSAALGSLLMGALANYPIALAPGMGLNAYFTYTVVKGMDVPWQTALGAVFLSGIVFLILTVAGVRQLILAAIPPELYAAVAAGVGLFIAFIGLRNAGIVAPNPETVVRLGDLHSPSTLLAICGLFLMAGLLAWRVRAAMLIGILATTAVALAAGHAHWAPQGNYLRELPATALRLDVGSALHLGVAEIVFAFLFIDLFDNIGTLVAVGTRARLFDKANRIPRLNRVLLADACATIFGSLAGTSTVVSYIESAAGVEAGGRTGAAAIVTGLLFLAALAVAPVAGAIPSAATAPALVIVGSLMAGVLAEIDWSDAEIAIPAFLTMVTIPLSFSIANGLAFGFISWTAIKVLRGKFRQVSWFVYLLTGLFLLRFWYLKSV
ncbi:MAG TPA: NCS2 family permease [Bryobacteraceae bacterium]|jgi:AGZA family xanthine/uracil permease-like MFS transporter|nr:NCS2 family permease [Bryobacteraceae bacterium]